MEVVLFDAVEAFRDRVRPLLVEREG